MSAASVAVKAVVLAVMLPVTATPSVEFPSVNSPSGTMEIGADDDGVEIVIPADEPPVIENHPLPRIVDEPVTSKLPVTFERPADG
jgi:hypothetical protein